VNDQLLLSDGVSRLLLSDGTSVLLLSTSSAGDPSSDPTPYRFTTALAARHTTGLVAAGTSTLDNRRTTSR
jgi:hypothetical protein